MPVNPIRLSRANKQAPAPAPAPARAPVPALAPASAPAPAPASAPAIGPFKISLVERAARKVVRDTAVTKVLVKRITKEEKRSKADLSGAIFDVSAAVLANDISGLKARLTKLNPRALAPRLDGGFLPVTPEFIAPPVPVTLKKITITQAAINDADDEDGYYELYDSQTTYALASDISLNTNFYFDVDAGDLIFDGQGHTITINDVSGFEGLFRNPIYVRNLTIRANRSTLYVFNGIGAGWIFGSEVGTYYSQFVVENCVNYADISANCGGMIGAYSNNAYAINCVNYGQVGSIGDGGYGAGGIIGYSAGEDSPVIAYGCTNYGSILGDRAGGIIGEYAADGNSDIYVAAYSCINRGAIASEDGAGGIFGADAAYYGRTHAISCSSYADVSGFCGGIYGADAGYDNIAYAYKCNSVGLLGTGAGGGGWSEYYGAGGIFGNNASGIADSCWSEGDMYGGAGGIFGNSTSGLAVNCYSRGNIYGGAGGILGASSFFAYAVRCHSSGNIDDSAGGIVGRDSVFLYIDQCYSTGKIGLTNIVTQAQAENYGVESISGAGGIVGFCPDELIITNCHSTGQIGAGSGGIAGGEAEFIEIANCYSTGNINVGGGGIVGVVAVSNTISNCYSKGTIGEGAGGIVGSYSICDDDFYVCNSYSRGRIGRRAGGIYGAYANVLPLGAKPYAENCYSSGHVSRQAGGIYGSDVSNVELQYCYMAGTNTATYAGADSSSVTVISSRYSSSWRNSIANIPLYGTPDTGTGNQQYWSYQIGTANRPYVLTTFAAQPENST